MYHSFLEGQNIYLREVRLSDVNESYYNWLNDSEISQFLETRFIPRSLENISNFVKSLDGNTNEVFLAICLKKDNKHIGNIKLGPINWLHRHADISLLIGDKTMWGQGVATEAIYLVTQYGFNILNLNKIKAGCYAENKGSAQAFIKNGYREEGLLKEHFFSNGRYTDAVVLGITHAEWNSRN